ncbi:aminopeptidase P family protein [Vibrio sp. FNV 38]|nr:aminopeptidase P family protein [Vibrio sp. FNV 38]
MDQQTQQKITSLREWLTSQGYDALILPHEDEYLGEYIPAHNERLHWLTGFTGSAGAVAVTLDRAAIFVDGRYTVQVTKQVPADVFQYCHLVEEPAIDWLCANLEQGSKIAIDPRMHNSNWLELAQQKISKNHQICLLKENPIDLLWSDRPEPKCSEVRLMATESVGLSCEAKRETIGQIITENQADAAVITALDSIAWLLNVRGLDVSRLPVLLSHAIAYRSGNVDFFIEPSRLPSNFAKHAGQGVTVYPPEALQQQLETLNSQTVIVDPATTNAWIKLVLQNTGATTLAQADPTLRVKACKNSIELAGMEACHIRDGVAMIKFLSWLDNEVEQGRLSDEAQLSDQLEVFRREDPTLIDLSFDTISAAGSNAAMCHYNHENQPQPGQLSMNSLYLVDSGGQYLDGTTDITRTIAIGQPSVEMQRQFTLVLKGHIGIARARFPKGTRGYQLDTLARQHLWAEGFDYDHGTGHGVGHFLSVHEGPQSISKRLIDVPLEAGMVLSNEPGYYRAEAFGIRIENLEKIVEQPTQGDFPVLSFESLTRCPIDVRNVDVNLLTKPELSWLNEYHQTVWQSLSPLVTAEVKTWLEKATQPLSHQ